MSPLSTAKKAIWLTIFFVLCSIALLVSSYYLYPSHRFWSIALGVVGLMTCFYSVIGFIAFGMADRLEDFNKD